MFVRQNTDCVGADEVSSRSFLFGNEVHYIPPNFAACGGLRNGQRAMKIVNLNQYRKRRRRSEENVARLRTGSGSGAPKAERRKDLGDSERVMNDFEGKRLD
jgi:hypothetical protein